MPNEETRENAHATEGPYPVPGNWRWGRFSNLVTLSKEKTEDFSDMTVRYVGLENMRAGGGISEFTAAAELKSLKNVFHSGQILYGKLRPYLSKHAVAPCDGVCSTDILVFDSTAATVAEYVDYLLETMDFRVFAVENSKGINLPRVSTEKVLGYSVPVPPRAEQRRIVERVERLFAKLDAAKEKAQSVIGGCEKRKAAILHKAFSGDLTAEWRSERDISENSWKQVPLSSVCSSIFDGDHLPPPKSETGIPFLVIGNVSTGYLSFENTRFVPREYYDSLSAARKPQFGDILYTLVGSYGIPIIVDSERPFCFQRHMALLKPSCINTRFLWYQLQSREFYNQASEIATGTAQLTVPIKGLRNLLVNLPCEEEQRKIVSLLDSLLFGNKRIQSDSEHVLRHLASLKNSILARAFRGELGTNDPSELPAAL